MRSGKEGAERRAERRQTVSGEAGLPEPRGQAFLSKAKLHRGREPRLCGLLLALTGNIRVCGWAVHIPANHWCMASSCPYKLSVSPMLHAGRFTVAG